jgi:hypothetical protein
MLDIKDLNGIKIRMLVAGEVARLIVTQQEGEPLNISADKYDLVVESLEKLDSDVRSVLSELDVLRGYVTGSFDLLVKEEEASHGCDGDVEGTRLQEGISSGEGERDDPAGTGGTAGSSGTDGKKPRRSKPRRNRRGSKKDQSNVEREDAGKEVDSSTATN